MRAHSAQRFLLAVAALLVVGLALAAAGGLPTLPERAATRAAASPSGVAWSPGLDPGDRAWIEAAITSARPEARPLLAAATSRVSFRAMPPARDILGVTRTRPDGRYDVVLEVAALDGRRRQDRPAVVLHELGHVIDLSLLTPALRAQLDAGIPRGGACGPEGEPIGGCAVARERFADTFARWALRGAMSQAGAGYMIPAPASLEDWGAPLTVLATQLPAPSTS